MASEAAPVGLAETAAETEVVLDRGRAFRFAFRHYPPAEICGVGTEREAATGVEVGVDLRLIELGDLLGPEPRGTA